MSGTEEHWANTLSAARRKSAHETRTPLPLRKKRTDEEFTYYKKALKNATDAEDMESAEKYLNMLIRLRAKQSAIFLEEEKKKKGGVYDDVLRAEVSRSMNDIRELLNET